MSSAKYELYVHWKQTLDCTHKYVNIQALKSWQSQLIAEATLPAGQRLQLPVMSCNPVWIIHAMTEWSITPIAQTDWKQIAYLLIVYTQGMHN